MSRCKTAFVVVLSFAFAFPCVIGCGSGEPFKDYNDPEATVPDYLPSGGIPESPGDNGAVQPTDDTIAPAEVAPSDNSSESKSRSKNPAQVKEPTKSMDFD